MASRATTMWANQNKRCPGHCRHAYTLFEILLALGIIALLLAITIPLATDAFKGSPAEEMIESIEKAMQSARRLAVETGETRQFKLAESGLAGEAGIPSVELPRGWKLQVRRFTESRFRKPARDEFWAINGAGICDPLELRLVSEQESIILKFDPLTGAILGDEN